MILRTQSLPTCNRHYNYYKQSTRDLAFLSEPVLHWQMLEQKWHEGVATDRAITTSSETLIICWQPHLAIIPYYNYCKSSWYCMRVNPYKHLWLNLATLMYLCERKYLPH